MTEKTEALIAQLKRELEALPEEEQEEYAGVLLEALRRSRQEREDEKSTAHPSLDVLRNAQIEDLPSDYSERLDHYLYGAGEE